MQTTTFNSVRAQLVGIAAIALIATTATALIQYQIQANQTADAITKATTRLAQSQLAASSGFNLDQFADLTSE